MIRNLILSACAILALVPHAAAQTAEPAVAPNLKAVCAPSGIAYTRTTLYFGLARPMGTISERDWKRFVRDEVTPRFPQGFTVWEAAGQWRDAHGRVNRERAKVLLLVHAPAKDVRDSLTELIDSYKRTFQQESVLWETANVCAAF